jgi:hypothetical protein
MGPGFQGTVVGFRPTDNGAEIDFANASVEQVATLLEGFLQSDRFRLEKGTALNGSWGSGSALGRALGGGFVRRRKFEVKIAASGNGVHVDVRSVMSGISGSVLGVSRERAQRKDFVAKLKTFLETLSPFRNGAPPIPPPP